MLPYLFVLFIGVLFYQYAVRPMSYWKSKGVKQTNPIWFFGDIATNVLRLSNVYDMKKRIYDSHPNDRYLGFYEFTTPTLLIKDPKLLKLITIKNFENFMDHRQVFPKGADPLFDRNLLALKGREWKGMRPVLSPAFTSNKMKIMYNLMNDCAEKVVTFFQKKDLETVEIKMKDLSSRFSNDVIATSAFGISVDSTAVPENEVYLMGQNITQIPFWKILQARAILMCKDILKIWKFHLFDDPGRSFFANLIEETMRTREEKGIVRPDMIQLMMEAKTKTNQNEKGKGAHHVQVTNEDIISNSIIFLFAGSESVSTLITFSAYELAVNREIQKRLRREIENAFAGCQGKLTYEALFNMKYLDMVITETLREWPSFGSVGRVCTKKFTIEPELPHEQPLVIEKGTQLELPIMCMQRDPKYFPDPERFDPERFSEENKDMIESCSYFPFGLGPRLCIGNRFALMEAKIFFANILRAFEIVPISKTTIPIQLSKHPIALNPESDVYLGLKRHIN